MPETNTTAVSAPPEIHPATGGSYIRHADGSLERVEGADLITEAPAAASQQSPNVEA